jgi:hypothetical protein
MWGVARVTKVQIRFGLQRQLNDQMMGRIAEAHSLYGIMRVKIDPSRDGLTVEYDASRLKSNEVEAAFERSGIPVQPK